MRHSERYKRDMELLKKLVPAGCTLRYGDPLTFVYDSRSECTDARVNLVPTLFKRYPTAMRCRADAHN